MATTELRLHETQGHEHQVLLEVVNSPRIKASRDRDFASYRWIPTEPELLDGYSYWAPTHPKRSTLITIDLDTTFDYDVINDLQVMPNWVGINTKNKHSQLMYYLEEPVYGERGTARSYYNAVARGLTYSLGGDPHFSRHMARNPFDTSGQYTWHAQHDDRFTLDQLHGAVIHQYDGVSQLPVHKKSRAKAEQHFDKDGLMRYNFLYDSARFNAYAIRGQGRFVEYDEIRSIIDPINTEIALTDERGGRDESTLDSIAKSVSTWCNTHMLSGKGSGQPLFTIEQCQRGGRVQGPRNVNDGTLARAREVSSVTRSANSIMLAAEIQIMKESGMSHAAIAAYLGVSGRTVTRALN